MGRFLAADQPFGKGGFFGVVPPPPAASPLIWSRTAAPGTSPGETFVDVCSSADPDAESDFLAVSNAGGFWRNTGGVTWAKQSLSPILPAVGVQLASDEADTVVCLLTDAPGNPPIYLIASTDRGVTWTDVTPVGFVGSGVFWEPTLALFIAYQPAAPPTHGTAWTSADGLTWNATDLTISFGFPGIAPPHYESAQLDDGAQVIVVGQNASASPADAVMLNTVDGLSWDILAEFGAPDTNVEQIVLTAGGLYMALSATAAGHRKIYTSPDSNAWTQQIDQSTPLLHPPYQTTLVAFGDLVLSGFLSTDATSIARSADGAVWASIALSGAGYTASRSIYAGLDIFAVPRAWVFGTGDPQAIFSSADGATWALDPVTAGSDMGDIANLRSFGADAPTVWSVGTAADGTGGIWLLISL